jgi:hypothetical protein
MRVAPDHAVVRLNYCIELQKTIKDYYHDPAAKELEENLNIALASENSPTMRYHTERPKRMARANAYLLLADLRNHQDEYAEADKFLALSWAEEHLFSTWTYWLDLCKKNRMDARLDTLMTEGLRAWPGKWWPLAQRGIKHFDEHGGRGITGEIVDDLAAAERVPNMFVPGLARIQAEALQRLALVIGDKQKAMELVERLRPFVTDEDGLEALRQQILRQ